MLKIIKVLLIISSLLLNINYTYSYYNSNNRIINSINTTKYNIQISNNFDNIDNKISIIGNKVILPIVNRRGYSNTGFRVNNNIYNNSVLIDEINNKEITPLWELINYNISYDLDGGVLNNMINTYNIEDNFVLDKPNKTGYKFIGWTGSNGDVPEENIIINNMIGDKYYKANYIVDKCKININSIIQDIKYNDGLSGFTFDVYINDELIEDDVIDYEDSVNYNSKIRIVMNDREGYNIKSIKDNTFIIKNNMNIELSWYDDIDPIITNFITEKIEIPSFYSSSLYSTVIVKIEGYDLGSGIDKYYTWYYADIDNGDGRIEGDEHIFERVFRVNTTAGKTFCGSITDKASNTTRICRVVNIDS